MTSLAVGVSVPPLRPAMSSIRINKQGAATNFYHKTRDLHPVHKALGHRQITTTEVYAKVNDQTLHQALSC